MQLIQFMKCWQIFLELNSKRLYQSSGKQKKSRLLFTSSTKREIRHFHVVVVQRRQRNVQKRVMHAQSCCFANLNLLLFSPSRCCRRRRHRCLSSLISITLDRTKDSLCSYENFLWWKPTLVHLPAQTIWKTWAWFVSSKVCTTDLWVSRWCDLKCEKYI